MTDYIIYGIVGVIALIALLLPKPIRHAITTIFSFGEFGLWEIHWRHDTVDLISNFILLLMFIFSVGYFMVPYYQIVYILLYGFAVICLLAQTYRVTDDDPTWKSILTLLPLLIMLAVAFFGAMGLFNQHHAVKATTVFVKALEKKELLDPIFWISNPEPLIVIFQALSYFASFYVAWAQFKSMRLDDTYKANNLFLLWIKIIFVCAILFGLNFGLYFALKKAFYVAE